MNFAPLLAGLGTRRSLVEARYPGTGTQAREPEVGLAAALNLHALADRLVAAMEAEGHRRFPIVGASFGCAVAMKAALRHPERVSALVLTVGFAAADVQLHAVVDVWSALVAPGAAAVDPWVLGAFVITALAGSSGL